MATCSIDKRMELILEKVIGSDRIIKSQQRGEPELTREEKREILIHLLHQTPGAFLMRFGTLLNEQDLTHFDNNSDYEVQYRIKELRRTQSFQVQQTRVRNRRYKAIEHLTETSDYFTEETMRERNPLLYEHYIGQYLSVEEKERMRKCQPGEVSLLAHVLQKYDQDLLEDRLKRQQYEENIVEEDDDSLEEEQEERSKGMILSDDPSQVQVEKHMLRKEFLRAMHLSFLNGEDNGFDYSTVDDNMEYDDLDIVTRDQEEQYFDSEEPTTCDKYNEDNPSINDR